MYSIIYSPKSLRDLEKIPKPWKKRIYRAIDTLRNNPFLGKKLEGELSGAYTLRVWPYRIIYSIRKQQITVIILDIGHRQSIYN